MEIILQLVVVMVVMGAAVVSTVVAKTLLPFYQVKEEATTLPNHHEWKLSGICGCLPSVQSLL